MRQHFQEANIQRYPAMREDLGDFSADEQAKEYERVNSFYQEGPAAYVIVAPTGEDMMGPMQLGSELAADIAAAFLVAAVVFNLSHGGTLIQRWLIVVALAVFAWLTLTASFSIWYRFPWSFSLDGLWGVLSEWGVAGLLIAALSRPYSQRKQLGAAGAAVHPGDYNIG
jgi:hypothetical protein